MGAEPEHNSINLEELFDLAAQLVAAMERDKSRDVIEIQYRWDGSVVVPHDLENLLNENRTQHG